MTTNPAEEGPHVPGSPVVPEPEVTRQDIPGVDPDWPQTARPASSGDSDRSDQAAAAASSGSAVASITAARLD